MEDRVRRRGKVDEVQLYAWNVHKRFLDMVTEHRVSEMREIS
jgi:hypothetical protein